MNKLVHEDITKLFKDKIHDIRYIFQSFEESIYILISRWPL